MLMAPNFPVRLTSNYDDFNKDFPDADAPSLVKDRRFQGRVFTSADASTVAGYVRTYADGGRKHAFLVLSTSQDEYLRAYSIAPSQAMASLDAALGSSSSWSLFYRNRDVVIYELRSPEVDGP